MLLRLKGGDKEDGVDEVKAFSMALGESVCSVRSHLGVVWAFVLLVARCSVTRTSSSAVCIGYRMRARNATVHHHS